jgi:2-polyprenyl-6-methoxyphenol hydroxylase-like FAD-dependent oxidoreductase
VIILGDGAHAIPPSAGQSINQAFEDVYIFALLLGQADKVEMQASLSFWQEYRQKRIEKVMWLNKQIELRRLPLEEQDKLPAGSIQEIDLSWLYRPDFKDDMDSWVAGRLEKGA